jgi:DNA-directed RNA polymerase-4 subunit 1
MLGFMEIQKVDILWNDKPKIPKSHNRLRGELFLRVHMSRGSDKTRLWNQLMDDCLSIMDLIDWARSHPDNIHECCLAYGIDAGWKFFLNVRTIYCHLIILFSKTTIHGNCHLD